VGGGRPKTDRRHSRDDGVDDFVQVVVQKREAGQAGLWPEISLSLTGGIGPALLTNGILAARFCQGLLMMAGLD
jgi:hypothetical protein